jgi:hypothetical protein
MDKEKCERSPAGQVIHMRMGLLFNVGISMNKPPNFSYIRA